MIRLKGDMNIVTKKKGDMNYLGLWELWIRLKGE